MKLVLDATALRSGMQISGDLDWYTTPSVMSEIARGKQGRDMELLKDVAVKVMEPSEKAVAKVRDCAGNTCDTGRLSSADIEILALAYDLGGVLLTDDYSIQNVAEVLGIEYRGGSQRGIEEVIHWTWRCRGCGRYFDAEPGVKECPVCGSGVRTVRKK